MDWPSGATAGFDDAVMAVYCRAVATTAMTVSVGPSDTALDGTVARDGIYWKGQNLTSAQAAALSASGGSGLPFVLPSNLNKDNTSGAITVATAFSRVIGPSYAWFKAAGLNASNPAGWYYTVWSSATQGVVYADVYTNGSAQIPTTPQALTTTTGAYVQSVGFDIMGPSFVIPGNTLGKNGFVEWSRVFSSNNSAGAKTYNSYLGATSFQGGSQTTNQYETGMGAVQNQGRPTAQIAANAGHGDNNNAGGLNVLAVDTTGSQTFSFSLQTAVATDYAIVERHYIKVNNVP
jgi:hypothetical protein